MSLGCCKALDSRQGSIRGNAASMDDRSSHRRNFKVLGMLLTRSSRMRPRHTVVCLGVGGASDSLIERVKHQRPSHLDDLEEHWVPSKSTVPNMGTRPRPSAWETACHHNFHSPSTSGLTARRHHLRIAMGERVRRSTPRPWPLSIPESHIPDPISPRESSRSNVNGVVCCCWRSNAA
ncbi:hypothetical protein AUP68_01523 [Ilyonectria robusta]